MSNKVSAFNSFLLAVLMAVSAWIGNKVVDMGESVSAMHAMKAHESEKLREIQESLKELKNKLGDTVTRDEFQQRLQQVERRLTQIEGKFR